LDDYDVLVQHISTLPTGAPINVNTASSAVIASLAPYMASLADELRVVDDEYWQEYPGCPEGGGLLDSLQGEDDGAVDPDADPDEEQAGSSVYESIEEFRSAAVDPADPENNNLENVIGIDVKSQYYMTRVTVKREDITVTQYTTFFRDNNGALQAVRRSRGGL